MSGAEIIAVERNNKGTFDIGYRRRNTDDLKQETRIADFSGTQKKSRHRTAAKNSTATVV